MKYKNIFNLSDELAQTITKIISKKENENYACGVLNVVIPEHKGLVFISPFDDGENWGGPSLSGAEIRHLNEKYGRYEEGIIPEEVFSYLVIMKKDLFKSLYNSNSFSNKEDVEKTLNELSEVYKEYDGIFDYSIMVNRFPYLQSFFSILDKWREQTGRVILDNDVLEHASRAVFKNTKNTFTSKDERTLK